MSITQSLAATAIASLLGCAALAHAADVPLFTATQNNSNGQVGAFTSTAALKKGDLIRISALNAPFIAQLYIGICNENCSNARVIKVLPLSFLGLPTSNQTFAMPEAGRVVIWMQNSSRFKTILGVFGGTTWTIQYVEPYSSYIAADPIAAPVPISSYTVTDNILRARFYHRTFLTVSVAGTPI